MSSTYLRPPIWTRRIANELWSGPVTPLTYSLLAEPMAEHMVGRPLRVAGLASLAALPVLRRHASHVYVNAALLAEVIELLPAGLRSRGLLDLLPREARAAIGDGSSWLASGGRAATIALRSWLGEPSWAPWQRADAFERECAAVRRELEIGGTFGAKPTTADPRAELAAVRRRLGRYLDVVSWGVVFAYVFYHLVYELARQWAPGLDAERAALTVGIAGIASLEAHHELRALAPFVTADPNVAAALATEGPKGAARRLAEDVGPAGRAFRSFLARHGHRLTGRDLTCPTWRESPAMVIELVAPTGGTRSGAAFGPGLDFASAQKRRLDATARIEQAFGSGAPGIARRAIFRVALANAQRYYALRENMRYHADFFLARMRELVLQLGTTLAADGRLTAPDDVFWLDVEELGRVADGDRTLADSARERRDSARRDAASPPPETLVDSAVQHAPPAPSTTVLRGESGAPGRCSGRARLIHDPSDFERVAPGDVLIAVYTDPGWTPVLERAAGLVLEAGGLLSHGAIVARELGIPALVGVADATRVIRDGDVVEIDAATGEVSLVGRLA